MKHVMPKSDGLRLRLRVHTADLSCVPEYGTVRGALYALLGEVALDPPWNPHDFVRKFQYQDDKNG